MHACTSLPCAVHASQLSRREGNQLQKFLKNFSWTTFDFIESTDCASASCVCEKFSKKFQFQSGTRKRRILALGSCDIQTDSFCKGQKELIWSILRLLDRIHYPVLIQDRTLFQNFRWAHGIGPKQRVELKSDTFFTTNWERSVQP